MLTIELVRKIKLSIEESAAKIVVDADSRVPHELKLDGSEITALDHEIHHNLTQLLGPRVLSEEGEHILNFPSFVLDPIDGTKDLVRGLAECATSLAYMAGPNLSQAQGFIFNPFTGFAIDSFQKVATQLLRPVDKNGPWLGMVSRSEVKQGCFESWRAKSQYILSPRGSIAFKLGLLAAGACDFVLTLRPKNIWDIAAGTALCAQRGIMLSGRDGAIEQMDFLHHQGPLLWCRPVLAKSLWKEIEHDL